MAVFFHFNEVRPVLKDRRPLKAFLADLFHREGLTLQRLDYIFCKDAFLLEINRQYLQHDNLTDIITFDLSNREGQKTAEIYISTERVKENAEKFGASFDQELHRVMFHGVLHLCGYGDKSPGQKKLMRAKENEALKRYSVVG
jgi:rRNA maturation RNase YbeY